MDFDKIERYLKHTLQFLYARVILELLNDVVKENCYGCDVDHPSQAQHTCLMWTKLEHLDIYFDLTFNKIDEKDKKKKIQLQNQINLMDIPQDYKRKCLNNLMIGVAFISQNQILYERRLRNIYYLRVD